MLEYHKQPTGQAYETERQWAVGYNAGLDRALYTIAYFPDVDAAPVVHGKWLNFYGDFSTAECNKCTETFEVSTDEEPKEEYFNAFKQFYKFCPNCGAKMDGKDDAK